ncbi:MAG TPA: energy transducer TonB [Polyangiaceae bacterium]|jgi:protein TonB|nr:energy transducer TonB [Polyangiaceae bacterium]
MNAPRPTPAMVEVDGHEPLDRVLGLGRSDRSALAAAFLLAIVAHATAGKGVFRTFPYLRELASAVRKGTHDRLHQQVEIDEDKPPPPPPPPPEPEKEPAPPPPPAAHAPPPPPEAAAKPPAAAEAAKVLTQDPDPDEPVDLTGEGFVTGNGDRFAGGVTAAKGTSRVAARAPQAAATGTGTGAGPVAPPAPTVNLTRTAGPGPGDWNDCGFPPEAEAEGLNVAKVMVSVTVRSDGRARAVSVLKDPGYGFGSWARQCAMRKSYQTALNAQGQPVEQTTPPFTIRFTR